MFVMSSPSSQPQRYQQQQQQQRQQQQQQQHYQYQQPQEEEDDDEGELYLYHPSSSASFAARGRAAAKSSTSLSYVPRSEQETADVLAALVSELSFWEQPPASSTAVAVANKNKNSRPLRGMLSIERARPSVHDDDDDHYNLWDDRVDQLVTDRTRSLAEDQDDQPSERDVVDNDVLNGNSSCAATMDPRSREDPRSSSSHDSSPSAASDERDWQQRAAALTAAAAVWKTAIDPVSGRAYYYDSLTRQTQWEKVGTWTGRDETVVDECVCV